MSDPKPRSCSTCPSALQADDAARFFGKSIGAPMCAQFGKPIGNIDSNVSERARIASALAKNCGKWNEPKPLSPNYDNVDFQVMLPDPLVIGRKPDAQSQELCKTCTTCKNFIKDDHVLEEYGWASGLCSAKGQLVPSNRYALAARNCEYREFGTPRSESTGMTFLPEYAATDPKVKAAIQSQHKAAMENFVDPTEYPTDKELTDEDKAKGLRAWRKIVDPITENHVYLPVYRIDFFDEEEQKKIPRTGDDEHPEDYIDHFAGTYKIAVLWTELDETPATWGEAGTGKTELFRHLAWLMCIPFERFSITGSTELDDLAGKMHYTEGRGTHFEYGRFVKAWRKPGIVVVDEPNTGPNEVWQFFRPLTDNSKQLALDMNFGELIDRDLDCYLGFAMNPAWDMRNVGANQIGDADANRMMHLFVQLPSKEVEKEIIATRCKHDGWDIPVSQLETVMRIGEDIRALCADGSLQMSWAIRPQIKVARALRWFDVATAYRMASADYLEPEQANAVMEVVKSHVE